MQCIELQTIFHSTSKKEITRKKELWVQKPILIKLKGFILLDMQSKQYKFSRFLESIIILEQDLHVNPVNPV